MNRQTHDHRPTRPPAATRPRLRRRIASGLLALALTTTACSDAYTEEEKERVDGARDPSVLTIYAPVDLARPLADLTRAFTISGGDAQVLTVIRPEAELLDSLLDDTRPGVWIDSLDTIDANRARLDAAESPVVFGDDPLRIWVPRNNPAGVASLDVFGDDPTTRSGMCDTSVVCGRLGAQALADAQVTPAPDYVGAHGRDVMDALVNGDLDAALVTRSQRIGLRGLEQLPLQGLPSVEYAALALSTLPTAERFVTWLLESTEADDILKRRGLRAQPLFSG